MIIVNIYEREFVWSDVYQTGRRDRPMAPNMHHFFWAEYLYLRKETQNEIQANFFFLMCEYLIVAIMWKQKKVEVFMPFEAFGKTGDIFSVWYTIASPVEKRQDDQW
jgi:hypothetical protein